MNYQLRRFDYLYKNGELDPYTLFLPSFEYYAGYYTSNVSYNSARCIRLLDFCAHKSFDRAKIFKLPRKAKLTVSTVYHLVAINR